MTTTRDSEITWGAYARLSRLKSGQRKRRGGHGEKAAASTVRQVRLIREYAEAHGLNLPEELIYVDPGRSAWKKDGARPAWDAMLAAGTAGRFGGLLTWKLDRFARNVRDGEDLVDLGLLLDGPASGRIDTRTAHGKSVVRKQFEAATNYSDETSEKVRAAFADMLAGGYRIGGSGRMFGFDIAPEGLYEYDEDEGRITGPAAVYREDEAEVIRDLARRLLDGETAEAMCVGLNGRGITTTRGGQWNAANLARTLGNPIYGGWLTYKGEPVRKLANVKAILDDDVYDGVQAKLGARKTGRKATGKYPLTGVMRCGNPACKRKGTMAGFTRYEGPRAYICAKPGKVPGCGMSVLAEPAEALVRDEVLAELADVEMRERARAADAALDRKRAELNAVLDDLDADMAETEKKLSAVPRSQARRRDQIQKNLDTMTARYARTERELEDLGPVTAPAPLLPAVTAAEWDDPDVTPAADKAAYIRQLGLRITILPPTRKQGSSRLGFDTARVRIEPGR